MNNSLYFLLGWGAPIGAAIFAFVLVRSINRRDAGTEKMQQIAALIRSGAMAFLRTEYQWLAVFVAVMFVILVVFLPGNALWIGVSFLVGAVLSATAGWVGMRTATGAAVRTTAAAQTSLAGALQVAFSSGAVMGLTVVALGTLGIAVLYFLYGGLDGDGPSAIASLLGMSLGASSIALFARVGGGIFTKAADVAADLSGKIEAGIPEDDPRNPATIADNVGDNVGDVAGMGADLFESYVGSIIASVALAWAMTAATAGDLWGVDGGAFDALQADLAVFPVLLAGVGIIASMLGTFTVRTDDESKVQSALTRGLFVASGIVLIGAAGLIQATSVPWAVLGCVGLGVVAGVVIGKLTEYYTGKDKPPARHIAKQSETGPATNIIAGLGVGMMSCGYPVLVICAAIFFSYGLGDVYGVAIAAVGMLSTLGISLGVDAYGPVADNAGGIAEMSKREPFVRERTDALDAVGNTTAAMGKGFAIGSAALTALAPGDGGRRGDSVGRRRGVRPAFTQPRLDQPERADRDVHRRDAAVHLLGDDDERGRPVGERDDRGGPPAVQEHPRAARGQGGARLGAVCRDFDPFGHQRDDLAGPAGRVGAGADRVPARGVRVGRVARWGPRHRRADGLDDGQRRRRLGQREEADRRNREGLGAAQGGGHRRHRRRPVQGHLRAESQHPDQVDDDCCGHLCAADRGLDAVGRGGRVGTP